MGGLSRARRIRLRFLRLLAYTSLTTLVGLYTLGKVANEDLQPAPPTPRRRLGRNNAPASTGSSRGTRSSRSAPEDDLYDQIVDPNLDLLPEDLPLEPLPELTP